MTRKMLIAAGVLITLALVAMIVQVVSHRMWERRVWSCYSALGSGVTPLPDRLLIPPVCKANAILVNNLGSANAEVVFGFRPPTTMWLSYVLRTVEYDSYTIEVSRRDGVTRAHMHHGSD
jgi:hypothetical protein